MKKIFLAGLALLAVAPLIFSANTAAASSVNYNNVISDAVFDNVGSMSASQIDAFLNTFPNSCLSQKNGYTFADPTGYSPTTSFTYGANVTAGKVIFDAAQAYGINPQVLLTTMQKEQGMVDGSGPYGCGGLAYSAAMGYGCPDGGSLYSYKGIQLYVKNGTVATSDSIKTCVKNPNYVGFSRQVINAAWLLTFDRHRSEGLNEWHIQKANWDNSDDLNFCYRGPMANTNGKKVYQCPSETSLNGTASDPLFAYSGQYSFDGTLVTIADGATAALFHYTPHLHGQALFYNIFVPWFGNTSYAIHGAIGDKYNSLNGANGWLGLPLSNEIGIAGGVYQQFQNGRIYWKSGAGAWTIHGGVGTEYFAQGNASGWLGFPTSDEIGTPDGVYQQFQNGQIYWVNSTGKAWDVHGAVLDRYSTMGLASNWLGVPSSNEIGIAGGVYQQFQNGCIYWSQATGAWGLSGTILTTYNNEGGPNSLGFPTSGAPSGTNVYQNFQGGQVYLNSSNDIYIVHGGIYGHYSAIGAENSHLGAPTANESDSASGAYQQFQNGRIYWSNNSGTWEVSGPVLTTYKNAGDSSGYLGYPTSTYPATSNGNYQNFQGGMIYLNSSTNLYIIHGAIYYYYSQLGGPSSWLGQPTSDEIGVASGVYQQFQNGTVYWSNNYGMWATHGGIGGKYSSFKGVNGWLGLPTSNEISVAGGVYQQFQNGRIYWSGNTGAWTIHGGIQSVYLTLGGPSSKLGFPKSDETSIGGSVYEQFQNGNIYWNNGYPTVKYN